MVRFVLYADNEAQTGGLDRLIRRAVRERGEWALIQSFFGEAEFHRYLHFVEYNPYLIMVVAADGQRGREIAMRIRANNPKARMLWFSDSGNCLYSYRVHVTCFGRLPVVREDIELALDACGILREEQEYEARSVT